MEKKTVWSMQEIMNMPKEQLLKMQMDHICPKYWSYNRNALTLECRIDGRWIYEIDLERCNNSAEVLDWIIQVSKKTWADNDLVGELVKWIDFVLHPQETTCSCGVDRTINAREILKSG